jgi:hypothetical protein
MDKVPPRLIVISERDHRFVDLTDAECGVGRAPENAIVVKDDMVSRKHCVIERASSGGYRVRDLKSFNGTYLNGERVQDEALKPWDSVRVGRTRIFYVEPSTSGPLPPPTSGPEAPAAPPIPGGGEVGEATMGMTKEMSALSPEARLGALLADPVTRAVLDDAIRRERGEVERQIGRRLRDESAPASTPIAAGLAARARRIGPLDGGGDFYDVFIDDRDPDSLLATVGTVSGQGIAASIAASGARYALRGVALAGTGDVLDRLARLRDLLARTLHPGTALSIAVLRASPGGKLRIAALGGAGVLVYRGARNEIEIARAVARRDEAAGRLDAFDLIVGAHDRVLLASDGTGSLRPPGGGDAFGETRLNEVFLAGAALPPTEALAKLVDTLVAHGSGAADRDATVVLLTKA